MIISDYFQKAVFFLIQVEQPAIVEGYFGSLDLEDFDENLGSNNWAISRGKSAAGYPILAGDPHLVLSLPSIWFEIQIHIPWPRPRQETVF